ncbi:MAG TPA: septation protein SpoVG, partial [Clostridiales bacterium]|nr:septation protein SpoVG [Clostridiales bacterium]
AVHDIKIIESKKGPFIAMPCRKTPSGVFKDIVHPINSETREMLQTLIINKYLEMGDEPDASPDMGAEE